MASASVLSGSFLKDSTFNLTCSHCSPEDLHKRLQLSWSEHSNSVLKLRPGLQFRTALARKLLCVISAKCCKQTRQRIDSLERLRGPSLAGAMSAFLCCNMQKSWQNLFPSRVSSEVRSLRSSFLRLVDATLLQRGRRDIIRHDAEWQLDKTSRCQISICLGTNVLLAYCRQKKEAYLACSSRGSSSVLPWCFSWQ